MFIFICIYTKTGWIHILFSLSLNLILKVLWNSSLYIIKGYSDASSFFFVWRKNPFSNIFTIFNTTSNKICRPKFFLTEICIKSTAFYSLQKYITSLFVIWLAHWCYCCEFKRKQKMLILLRHLTRFYFLMCLCIYVHDIEKV